MSDPGSAVPISGMQNSISQLPEEIVDIILRQLCSPDQVSAGSVCRRWYNITLPYLWRSIEVSGSDDDQHLRRPKSFLSVLTGNSVVGSLIHRLTFHHVQLDIPLVSRILALLPQLRYLNLAWISLQPFDNTTQPPSGWHGHGRFSLDELRLTYNPFRRYGVYDIAEVQLLSLFSRIDALFYDCSQHTQTTPTTPDALLAVVTPACRLSVDELFIEFGPILPSHIRLLLQCHALHNLTCLNLTGADLEGLQDIGHFLCIAGEPLVELILNLDWDLNTDGFNPSWDAASASDHSVLRREFARDAMRKGLEKCTNLHAFRFRMRTVAPAAIDYDLPVLLEIAAQGWIMALDIVALVHPGDSKGRLRHLALEYWNIVFSRWSCRWDVDFQSYHWARVRSICRRFEGLRFLGIEFCKRGPGTSTVGIFKHEIEQELQVFKDVYSPHWEFWTCEEPSCRIYAQTH